jgi:hypothetical protein
MEKYFKITNKIENHNEFIYKDGLNVLEEIFDDLDSESMCHGFYFTTIDYIPKYYYLGINLREILLPNDSDFKMIKLLDEGKYRANKIILGEKYSLYDPKIYKKFNLNMEYNIHLVNHASEHGDIDFLNLWKNEAWNLKYSIDAINLASQNGHTFILEWWKNSGFKLKYTTYAIDWACEMGHKTVLEWWLTSGLEIKYSHKAILLAIKNNHIDIIEWWKNNMSFDCDKYLTNNETNIIVQPNFISKEKSYFFESVVKWFNFDRLIVLPKLLFLMVLCCVIYLINKTIS